MQVFDYIASSYSAFLNTISPSVRFHYPFFTVYYDLCHQTRAVLQSCFFCDGQFELSRDFSTCFSPNKALDAQHGISLAMLFYTPYAYALIDN